MRWKKLKGTIIEHPYLICDDFHMSMRQASRLQEQEGYPSFEEMVTSARKRSNLPDAAWKGVYAVIDKQKGQTSFDYLRHLKMADRRLTARWVILGMCILLVVGYFMLIPSGKALAASIAKVIVEIFDDGLRFRPSYIPESLPEEDTFEEKAVAFTNYKDAQMQIGHPLIRLIDDKFMLDTLILYESNLTGSLLDASYYTQDGLHITLQQEWNINGTPWIEFDTTYAWEENLWDDATILYCYVDIDDNSMFTATTVWEDSIITIYADDGISYQEIVAALRIYE